MMKDAKRIGKVKRCIGKWQFINAGLVKLNVIERYQIPLGYGQRLLAWVYAMQNSGS